MHAYHLKHANSKFILWTSIKKQIKWNEPLYQEHKLSFVFIDFLYFFPYPLDFTDIIAVAFKVKIVICLSWTKVTEVWLWHAIVIFQENLKCMAKKNLLKLSMLSQHYWLYFLALQPKTIHSVCMVKYWIPCQSWYQKYKFLHLIVISILTRWMVPNILEFLSWKLKNNRQFRKNNIQLLFNLPCFLTNA